MSSIWDRFENWIFWGVTSVLTALSAGIWWVIRQVFTNHQQIELMQQEFKHRDQLRAEDREDMAEVKDSVKRIEKYILEDRL
jgi:hypothetical protein